MKLIPFCLFSTMIYSCSNKQLPKQLVPEEFLFPETKMELGKTFVYLNQNSGDTSYFDFFHSTANGKTVLIQCNHDRNSISDSLVYLNKKPIAYYINPHSDGALWNAYQISDTVLEDENGKANQLSEFRWKKDSEYVFSKIRIQVTKDTLLSWNGKLYPAIITNTLAETVSNFLKTPDGKYSFKMEEINYLCKGIGSVKRLLICRWIPEPIVTNLIEIKNMQ